MTTILVRRTLLTFLAALLAVGGMAAAVSTPSHLADAIRAQRRLINNRPGDTSALNDLGNLLTLSGALVQAEETYRRAIEITSEEGVTHYNLGLLLRQTGRKRAALRELELAAKLDPSDAWAHFQLGVLLEEKGKNSKAVHHYVEAFLLEPDLTLLEVNPQLLDSKLMTRAMTVAYSQRVDQLEGAPRQYERPGRITRLLVPEVAAADGGPTDVGAEDRTPAKRRRQKERRKNDSDASGGA